MVTQQLILVGAFEAIALIVIALMWVKRWHRRVVVRVIWSVVLLVPVFGLLCYFFLRESPDDHPYDTDTMRGAAETFVEGGGDHH